MNYQRIIKNHRYLLSYCSNLFFYPSRFLYDAVKQNSNLDSDKNKTAAITMKQLIILCSIAFFTLQGKAQDTLR